MARSPDSPLPVLDLRTLDDPVKRTGFLDDLRAAAHGVGFFYLTGTGVTIQDATDILDMSRRFFALPERDRMAIGNLQSAHFRGYTRVGDELTNGQADWRDQLDFGAERAASPGGPDEPVWRRLEGPNQWPGALPELRTSMLDWQDRLSAIAHRLLSALAASLGLAEDHFDEAFAETPFVNAKVVRYPGSSGDGRNQGVGAHKDYGFLTLLLQDNVGGLQVRTSDGSYLDAPPMPAAFIVNLGEMLEVATDGYLRATVHRVVSPAGATQRISVPFFYNPRLDAEVRPIVLSPELAAQARGAEDDPANPLLTTYGANALKGWLRAHPEVAARYYGDLLSAAR